MDIKWITLLVALLAVVGCTTPYRPAVVADGAPEFPGIAEIADPVKVKAVDVILVHGMCTHKPEWASDTINSLIRALDKSFPLTSLKSSEEPFGKIKIVRVEAQATHANIRFSAIIWSPLTTPLKTQLLYDFTDQPGAPKRASLNGKLKDTLVNDCLSDALAYQGKSKDRIQSQIIAALSKILENSDDAVPLVLITESLGSKITFDALNAMLNGKATREDEAIARKTMDRLAVIFMGANQIPLLGLADQDIGSAAALRDEVSSSEQDSLKEVLKVKQRKAVAESGNKFDKLALVAFTDPNDLLSYRLMPAVYQTPQVNVSDVRVSNGTTYFGWVENPWPAHTTYLENEDVVEFIACGLPKSRACR